MRLEILRHQRLKPLCRVLPLLASFALFGCPAGREVGNDVCLTCHNGLLAPDQSSFPMSAHHFLDCERCHGPGQAHVRNGGQGGLFIENPNRLPFDEHYELCAACHATQLDGYLDSDHARKKAVRCTDCHDVHTPPVTRLSFIDNELCRACHEFPSIEAISEHTFHSYNPTTTGASRCTNCHMPPLVRTDQPDGPHLHSMQPIPPIQSNLAMDAGIFPAPPNSCSGIMGCHDGTVITAPVFDVDDPEDNQLLQIIFESRYGETQ